MLLYHFYICMNGNVVKFPDGQKLNRVGKNIPYLGHQITQEMDVERVIQNPPDIENVVQIGHLLEDNSLFF